jgi:hypothetical protein
MPLTPDDNTVSCAHAAVNGDANRCPCRYTAREHLRCAWINLLDARIAADNAALQLTETRATRAAELVAKLGDAITLAQRLKTVVEGDERADQATARQARIR